MSKMKIRIHEEKKPTLQHYAAVLSRALDDVQSRLSTGTPHDFTIDAALSAFDRGVKKVPQDWTAKEVQSFIRSERDKLDKQFDALIAALDDYV